MGGQPASNKPPQTAAFGAFPLILNATSSHASFEQPTLRNRALGIRRPPDAFADLPCENIVQLSKSSCMKDLADLIDIAEPALERLGTANEFASLDGAVND
jgi:hypothetical protein